MNSADGEGGFFAEGGEEVFDEGRFYFIVAIDET